jgi:RHS repeat-associated protein
MVENTTNKQYVYFPGGSQVFAVMSGQTPVQTIFPLPGGATAVYAGSTYTYNHSDWLGSSRLTTTSTQTMASDSAYAPFGEQYAKSGSGFYSFTGVQQWTVSGIDDFLFRPYSPVQGRWISPDPAGLAAANPAAPQTWNRYAYAANSPLNAVDPDGLMMLQVPCCSHGFGTMFASIPTILSTSETIYVFLSESGMPMDPAYAVFSYTFGFDFYEEGDSSGGDQGDGGDQSAKLKQQLLNILGKNASCAANYGGRTSAVNLVMRMTIYQVPSPYAGPFAGAYDVVSANNNGALSGWSGAAATGFQTVSTTNHTWTGTPYGTFVGRKFNSGTLGQQLSLLFHEMAHPYLGAATGEKGVDDLNSMYSPFGAGLMGGVAAYCGTEALPPPK